MTEENKEPLSSCCGAKIRVDVADMTYPGLIGFAMYCSGCGKLQIEGARAPHAAELEAARERIRQAIADYDALKEKLAGGGA